MIFNNFVIVCKLLIVKKKCIASESLHIVFYLDFLFYYFVQFFDNFVLMLCNQYHKHFGIYECFEN
jgi:hypothetical protein